MKKWLTILLIILTLLLASCKSVNDTPKNMSVTEGGSAYIFLPPTREQFIRDLDCAVMVTITNTEIKNIDVAKDSELWMDMYTSTAKVEKVLWGNSKPNKTILIMQNGNNRDSLDKVTMDNGGYLEKSAQYILFLEENQEKYTGYSYYLPAIAGQLGVDKQGNIIGRSEWSDKYWSDVNTVDEMKTVLDSLVIPPTEPAPTTTNT